MASLLLSYIFWLCGGWFGLHHLYLKRDEQAWVWWASLGGVFGLGWVRDLWRIPDYVSYANRDDRFMNELEAERQIHPVPPFNYVRYIGEVIIGTLFGYLCRSAIPEEFLESGRVTQALILLVPVAVAFGVCLIAGIGYEMASFRFSLWGAFPPFLLYIWDDHFIVYSAMLSAALVNWRGKCWRLRRKERPLHKRILVLSSLTLVYLSLWGCALYYNAQIVSPDGETVKLRDAVGNFFRSPAWENLKNHAHLAFDNYMDRGFDDYFWASLWLSFDPAGDQWARKTSEVSEDLEPLVEELRNSLRLLQTGSGEILDLFGFSSGENPSQEELKSRYNSFVKKWHPDRFKHELDREKAQEKFMEYQRAYEILSSLKQQRGRTNQRSREEL